MDHYTIVIVGAVAGESRSLFAGAGGRVARGREAAQLLAIVDAPGLRFLRDYFLKLGFMDGAVGLQLSWGSAFYSFMKQARLWELHHARPGDRPAEARHSPPEAPRAEKSQPKRRHPITSA